jgi:hypothetical protein
MANINIRNSILSVKIVGIDVLHEKWLFSGRMRGGKQE